MADVKKLAAAVLTVATLAVTAVAVATEWSPFTPSSVDITTLVTPDAVTRNLSCTGAAVASVADSTQWTHVATTNVTVSGGQVAGNFATDTVPTGAVIAHDGDPNSVVASESVALVTDVMTGFLATECSDASTSAWLIGGSTETGRDAILTISNPTKVDARVDLEFFGANGYIEAPSSRGITVPAGAQRSYSVAGFAPGEPSPVIHVESNGAPVWSTLQVSTVRGLVPGGLDRLTGITEPAMLLSIPIIREPDADVIGPLRSEPGYADTETMMRFFVPGTDDAEVTLTITPHASDDAPLVVSASIAAREVVDIPIADLPDGDYSVTISSTVPIFAAARVSSHDSKTTVTDLAWVPALAPTNALSGAAVPFTGTLAIANPSDAEITVVVTANGNESSVLVGPFGTTPVLIRKGNVTVRSDVPFASSLFIETQNGIAAIRPRPAPLGAQAVTVVAH